MKHDLEGVLSLLVERVSRIEQDAAAVRAVLLKIIEKHREKHAPPGEGVCPGPEPAAHPGPS
jgi:hypothetical protein